MLHRCLILLCLLPAILGQRNYNQQQQQQYSPPSRPAEANDILSQVSDVRPDGSFFTEWKTANGISYTEQGQLKNPGTQDEAEQVQGSASWTSNDGVPISISWQADENGAVFQGDHLPTPPPAPEIPVLIQRALDWIAANPSKLSQDEEGQYREEDDQSQLAPRRPPPQPALVPRRPPPPPKRF